MLIAVFADSSGVCISYDMDIPVLSVELMLLALSKILELVASMVFQYIDSKTPAGSTKLFALQLLRYGALRDN